MLHYSPLLKNPRVRQVVLDRWFPLSLVSFSYVVTEQADDNGLGDADAKERAWHYHYYY